MSTPSVINIGARSSTLSQIQAHGVAETLQKAYPGLSVQFHWRKTQGDIDRITALAAFGGKGVFTEDLTHMLLDREADIIVHSWKDLPVQLSEGTKIGGTLPRADMRDLLIMKKEAAHRLGSVPQVSILSSSPRRERNLTRFLSWALPGFEGKVSFSQVRGNVPTRVRKLMEGPDAGLIVAKAALDRLLSTERPEFQESRRYIREALSQCYFMVLPLRENPCAPAQGALAIEIARGRDDIEEMLKSIDSPDTRECCEREREILASYGGGCHQKIGVAVLKRSFGRITFIQGETDFGQDLESVVFEPAKPVQSKVPAAEAWPLVIEDRSEREELPAAEPDTGTCLWVVKDKALPERWSKSFDRVVWSSGLSTWRKLARRGIWVNGSSEGLGESENPNIGVLLDREASWVKVTHEEGGPFPWGRTLVTYRRNLGPLPDLSNKSHFFWRSGSELLQALKEQPAIQSGFHYSGPGSTAALLQEKIRDPERVSVFLDHQHWLKEVVHP